MIVCLIIAVLLGWSLGKNNMGNLFGTAVGTRMIRLKIAGILALTFVFIGAFCSGGATTESVLKISPLQTPRDIIVVMLSAVFVLELLSRLGIPASIVQTILGALIGWNLFSQTQTDWTLVQKMIFAWFWAPALAAVFSFLLMHFTRRILHKYSLSIFTRDIALRIGLIVMGSLSAYTLGANNTGIITGPYLNAFRQISLPVMTLIACGSIALGCLMADKKVIATVGRRLFPLTPAEAMVVMFGTVISMACFSMTSLRTALEALNLPTFPLVPIPVSSVMIGAICGIALTKGGRGLNISVLGRIVLSWILVPVVAGALCWGLLCYEMGIN